MGTHMSTTSTASAVAVEWEDKLLREQVTKQRAQLIQAIIAAGPADAPAGGAPVRGGRPGNN